MLISASCAQLSAQKSALTSLSGSLAISKTTSRKLEIVGPIPGADHLTMTEKPWNEEVVVDGYAGALAWLLAQTRSEGGACHRRSLHFPTHQLPRQLRSQTMIPLFARLAFPPGHAYLAREHVTELTAASWTIRSLLTVVRYLLYIRYILNDMSLYYRGAR